MVGRPGFEPGIGVDAPEAPIPPVMSLTRP